MRRRNFIQPEQMPYAVGLTFRDGKPLVYDSGDYPQAPGRRRSRLADYDGFRERQERARGEGRFIGIGLANYVEGTGLGPFEGVTVRVLPNGKVAVATGATNQGQGTRTTLSQIVADNVGCRIEDIVDDDRRHRGDLARRRRVRQPAGGQCRLIGAASPATMCASRSSRSRRSTLDVPESDIDVEDGHAIARGGNKPSHVASAIWRGWRKACRASRCRPGQAAGPRTHGLFRAAAGRLLHRHACRRGRGRYR